MIVAPLIFFVTCKKNPEDYTEAIFKLHECLRPNHTHRKWKQRQNVIAKGYVFTGICQSTGERGVCPIACWDTPPCVDTPWADIPLPQADTPPEQTPPGQTPPPRQTPTLPRQTSPHAQCMLGYGQQADGTHPTGMHSCFYLVLSLVL